jgi:hypothetical protein
MVRMFATIFTLDTARRQSVRGIGNHIAPHTSRRTHRAAHIAPHTSRRTHRAASLAPHPSRRIPRAAAKGFSSLLLPNRSPLAGPPRWLPARTPGAGQIAPILASQQMGGRLAVALAPHWRTRACEPEILAAPSQPGQRSASARHSFILPPARLRGSANNCRARALTNANTMRFLSQMIRNACHHSHNRQTP